MTSNLLTVFDGLNRQVVGFDEIFNKLHRLHSVNNTPAYPPYNIIRNSDSAYTIQVAVAGFAEDELDVTLKDGELVITGEQKTETDTNTEWLHRGIAMRKFERSFTIADNVIVQGADLKNGLLSVNLEVIIPEDRKPRKIAISSSVD